MKLNNSSEKPLYVQLKQVIKEDINRGKYAPGEQLPPEAILCEMYGVSRITARRAISDMVEEGILHRQQGKGTFVKASKMKRELISVGGFSEMTTASNKTPSSQILSSTIVPADEELADVFRISEASPVLRLHRLLYIDNEPFIIETSYYPLDRFPDLEKHIGESASTYTILKNRYQTDVTASEKTLDVIFATAEEAALFRCDAGTPLYAIVKKSLDSKRTIVHMSRSLFMTSKVTFTINGQKE
ncbi:GntR family transcriptional regulator, frlABCD operon transcriptional regulator [Paenibacillus sp. UNCCL117]|uniref:GntR family transcriptional regulator n=1 Tax=unclassified Paenibacillus TaxID=185978 RepID=UPI00088E3CC3|nr:MULTISPECIES: GntR family transcriptional regulator [unclassified Paenibacillus]SDD05994.1 GntR family transcriptional regulator, frlABCD operon transcriptional regulator [Paenibacillus sp. cl123]SFW31784.1 GntR family transcriptional regulator, frlABCD operon transcriptional regulator [Paenibacillus sp. UNCCL117]